MKDPNRHGGWMIVVACFVSLFITLGINYSTGLYYMEWRDHFDERSDIVSWVGSLNLATLAFGSPVGSILAARYGSQKVAFVSGLTCATGLVTSAFVENIFLMMATYGVLTGFGFSLTFVSMSTAPLFVFNDKTKGLALGIAVSGAGCGGFLMPVMIDMLINKYGWKGSLLLLGGLNLNLCALSFLFRKPTLKNQTETTEKGRTIKDCIGVLKNVPFILLLLHNFLVTIGFSVFYVHIGAVVDSLAPAERSKSSLTLSVMGIVNFIGRILHPSVVGLKYVNAISQYLGSMGIAGCVLHVLPHSHNYTVLLILSGLFGFCTAPFTSLVQFIVIKFLGLENVQIGFSYIMFVSGFGLLIGAPIAGFLYDSTNGSKASMYFAGTSMLCSVLVMVKPWYDDIYNRPRVLPPKCDHISSRPECDELPEVTERLV